jgi:antitoxin (DNA-binding transcriptional repressor) of toxin-antitoxin stability system
MPKKVKASTVRATFRSLLADIRRSGSRVQITRYGQTVAWIVPDENGQALENCSEELCACKERTKRASQATTTRQGGKSRRET